MLYLSNNNRRNHVTHKNLLTESDIQQLQSITRGDNTAAADYRLGAVHTYVNHSAAEVASFSE